MSNEANQPNQPHSGGETAQTAVWKGDFGREYTDRNTLTIEGLDQLYLDNYGVSRAEINARFLRDIPKDASILEVGCNTGNQLLMLHQMGYSRLTGVEVQPYAVEIARHRLPESAIGQGSALQLPHPNLSFDLVFTSGVLIHIAPEDLPKVLDEIYRCSRTYIWGLEYYAPEKTEINYRSHDGLLWKADFARIYLERFPDLELVQEQKLPYRENDNVDVVFLLRKSAN